jgi:osmotically-inducible protein OsmY
METAMESDVELKQAIRRFISERPDVNDGEVEIQVCKGAVTLTGKMRSDLERWQIEDAIRAMPGVSSLVNNTMTDPLNTPSVIDPDIARPWFPAS